MTSKRPSKRFPPVPDLQERLCEANKLILKRMESNPDEFHLNKGGRWADYLSMLHARVEGDKNVLVMLETDECLFIWDKYKEVAKANLHKNFMMRILRADEPT